MRRIDLFPLRLARFVLSHILHAIRPTGPRERLLRKCRSTPPSETSAKAPSDEYSELKAKR
jgi:hypothetical protein